MTRTTVIAAEPSISQQRPYPPSWFDHFKQWVEKLPGPPWLFYLVLGILFYVPITLAIWLTDSAALGTFNFAVLWVAMTVPFSLVSMHYLDRAALGALQETKPALNTDENEFERLRYELTNMPARTTLLVCALLTVPITLFAIASMFLSPDFSATTYGVQHPVALTLLFIPVILNYWCGTAFVYHSIHQLRSITRIYRAPCQCEPL